MISVDVRQLNVDQQQNLKDRLDSLNIQTDHLTHIIFLSLWELFIHIKHYKAPQTLVNITLTPLP